MLAEAAHSVADALVEAFLLTSLFRSSLLADEEHPFGYGQERDFWSLLAAFGIFMLGARFSVFEGVLAIMNPSTDSGSALIAYIVVAVARPRGPRSSVPTGRCAVRPAKSTPNCSST